MTCPKCGHENKSGATKCAECDAALEKAKEEVGSLEEGVLIEGSDILPVVESRATLIVPKKGKVFEKRQVEIGGHVQEVQVGRFAIIRPCISRGRRLRGLPPVYEAQMLAESAGVFTGWPMYADHLTEQLKEAIWESMVESLGEAKVKVLEGRLLEAGRSIKELGGRLLNTWFDPELVTEEDAERGYRKGGVVGDVIPQPFIYEMLEADPGILNVSINAWPRRVRVGRPSWDSSVKGAVIEGIASKPPGSVDFVFRGGAGGRPLAEQDRKVAVTILESAYSSPRDGNPEEPKVMKKLAEMTADEIRALPKTKLVEMLREEGGESVAESVAEAVALGSTGGNGGGPSDGGTPLTEEGINTMLAEQRRQMEEGFEKSLKEAREEGDKDLRERDEARDLETVAHTTLQEAQTNGFPQAWVDQLKPRYTVTSTAIGSGLKLSESDLTNGEGEKVDPKDAMRERVKADVAEAIKLMEAGGGKPRVRGFGPTAADPQGEGGEGSGKPKTPEKGGTTIVRESREDAFLGFLAESGDITGDDERDAARLSEMVGGR